MRRGCVPSGHERFRLNRSAVTTPTVGSSTRTAGRPRRVWGSPPSMVLRNPSQRRGGYAERHGRREGGSDFPLGAVVTGAAPVALVANDEIVAVGHQRGEEAGGPLVSGQGLIQCASDFPAVHNASASIVAWAPPRLQRCRVA
jgi:hypothetical protein